MPPRRSPDRDVLTPDSTLPSDDPRVDASEPKTPLEQFIDVFHEDWKTLPLAAKLAKIGGTLGNVPKRGVNPIQHYRYVQETDLVAAIRPYLSAAGILLTFSVTNHEIIPRDAKSMLTHVTVHWTVTDGKESIEGDMPGYGMDTGDKGVYKAITGAKKYILMTLFLIDTGDDPENEAKPKQPQVARARDDISNGAYDDDEQDAQLAYEQAAPPPVVSPSRRTDIVRGGHTTEATDVQRTRLIEGIKRRGWTGRQFVQFVRDELLAALLDAPEDNPEELRAYINAMLNSMSPADMGTLIVGIERE